MLHTLVKVIPIRRASLKAPLSGVNGFTGRGAIWFSAWLGGRKVISINLRGVAGRRAELYADDHLISNVKIRNGSARVKITLPGNDFAASMSEGAVIEIRQNNDAILGGVLLQNAASRGVITSLHDMLGKVQKQTRQLWRSKITMKSPKISPPSRKN
jgi:hypothetical protein